MHHATKIKVTLSKAQWKYVLQQLPVTFARWQTARFQKKVTTIKSKIEAAIAVAELGIE